MTLNEFISQIFLFSGVNKKALSALIEENPPERRLYKRGELIYSSLSQEKLVGFVVEGKCEIRRDKSDGSRILLNTLGPSDSFGVLSVYSEEEFPTQIFAVKNSEILFFSADQIRHFVNNNSHIATNMINFLAGRISFLNKKIATFSGTRVEDRLAAFLICEAEKQGESSFPFNCQKTAKEINAGRASVYRALSAFEESGLISLVDKKIYLKDLQGLERITK